MITPTWEAVIGSLAVVALFISGWTHAQGWLENRGRSFRRLAFALWMGAGAVTAMLLSVKLQPGVIFDLRMTMLVLAGFFGGLPAAIIACTMAGLMRAVIGGQGMWPGILSIGLAGGYGAVMKRLFDSQCPRRVVVLLLGGGVSLIGLGVTMGMTPVDGWLASLAYSAPMSIPNGVATLLAAFAIIHAGLLRSERNLLRSAIAQAPDFFYVKNRNSRFVAVNQTVAQFNGFERPGDIVGKSDYDLAPMERARELFIAEQQAMQFSTAIHDREEVLPGPDGSRHHFLTSKVPLKNRDGETIGLVGTTRDVTERLRLEAALAEEREMSSYAMNEMADGLAMFDAAGILLFCNEQYRSTFPLTAEFRRPGASLRDILRRAVEVGEQGKPDAHDDWIEGVMGLLKTGGEEEVHLSDGRWVHIRTRPARDGSALIVVSDVTRIKGTEGALLALTEQLKALASTDGLTGLMNRRSFDGALQTELARSLGADLPLSLMMIDVDHFKAYNDFYGHQAGDECLRLVSRCLRQTIKRPADIVARYGGEEFVVVLPETDEDEAYFLADGFRTALRDLMIPHGGTRGGLVTASVGIAVSKGAAGVIDTAQLIARADAALYDAKAAGRDRVAGWRDRHLPEQRAASA